MYRILIVDDEPMIVEGLSMLFEDQNPWEIEVHKACLATEALQILNRQRIDILLTDIRMPAVSGIELMEKVRANWPDCKILFLTAFEEFEYAYTALKNPGVRFLLKTEGHEAIITAVQDCIEEIENELQEKTLRMRSSEQTGIIRALRIRDFLNRVLHTGGEKFSQAQLDEAGVPLQADEPVYLLLGSPISSCEDTLSQMNILTELLTTRMGEKARCVPYKGSSQIFVWFLQANSAMMGAITQTLPEMLLDELETTEAACKDKLVFVLARTPCPWEHLFYEYQRLKAILHLQASAGEKLVYIASETSAVPSKETDLLRLGEGCKKEIQLLKADLEMGNRQVFSERLGRICEKILEIGSHTQNLAQELAIELNLLFLSRFNRIAMEGSSEKMRELAGRLRQVELSTPLSQKQYLSLGEAVFEFQSNSTQIQTSDCINRVKTYICGHLGGDLSLSRLAQLSNYNPKYLSDLFRAQTGVNLSDYIADKRLEEAKRLIAQGDMKMKDISAAVGFFSSSYFTRFFKKASGMTPVQYQERAAGEKLDRG